MILQLTDLHVGAEWSARDPLDTLRTVIAAVRALPQRPSAVLVTGDLTNDGTASQYAAARSALAELELPVHVMPGNHDDRAQLRRGFDLPGDGADPIRSGFELDGLRVITLDSTRPGEGDGELGDEQLAWLRDALAAAPQTTTLLALHHPPFLTGVVDMDRYALAAVDRDGLARVVGDHPQVAGVIAGHVHRTMVAEVGGRPALSIPSTYCQLTLDFAAPRLSMSADEPLAYALHGLGPDGRLVSYVQSLAQTAA